MTKRASKAKAMQEAVPAPVITMKGLDADFSCRGFKFEIGKTYRQDGLIKSCNNGFHSCPADRPFAVWEFYPPAGVGGRLSRYAECTIAGETDTEYSKMASAEITIKAELSLPQFVQRTVDWIVSNAKEKKIETGYQSAATNTGDRSAATNTGDRSAAEVSGKNSTALAAGYQSCAKASEGSAIFLCERNDRMELIAVFAGIAGRDGIKPDVWYWLIGGNPVEQPQAA